MNGQFSLGDMHPIKYFFGISIGLGLLFTFVSGDTNLLQSTPFGIKLIQWQLQTSLPMGLLILSQLTLAKIHVFNRLGMWQQVIFSGVVGATLFVPMALLIDIYMIGEIAQTDLWRELIDEWLGVMPPVVITWVLINIPWLMGLQYQKINNTDTLTTIGQPNSNSQRSDVKPIQKKSPEKPDLVSLLPENVRGELYYISSELHYLKVVTENGKGLILGSLRDNIELLPETLGMQVHRSYWVSFAAVKNYLKNGRQGKLMLINGEQIPVSRSFTHIVKEKFNS